MAVQAPSVLTLALNFRVSEMTGDCFLAPWREMKEFKKNKQKKNQSKLMKVKRVFFYQGHNCVILTT